MTLAAAKEHLGQQRADLALAPLLAVWRKCRAPALADLIDQVSAAVNRPALKGSAKARHAEFLSLLKKGDPADGARMLAFLGEGQTAHLAEALEALSKAPADPRFTPRALALLQRPPVTSSSSFAAWRKLFALLIANEDVRALAALKRFDFNAILGPNQAYSAEFFDTRTRKVVEALEALKVPTLSAADAETVQQLSGGRRAATRDLSSLEAAVYAAPNDDAPRLVYADALLEKGDPRGEFLTLQFAREKRRLTNAERQREHALQAEHQVAWLGPLALTVDEWSDLVIFRRGFVHTLAVASEKPAVMKALLEAPGFSTVRTLSLRLYGESPLPEAMLRSPAFAHLTGLAWLDGTGFVQFFGSKEPWPYEEVLCSDPSYEPAQFKIDLKRIIDSRAVPRLKTLKVSGYLKKPAQYAPLWSSELGQRLTGFGATQGIYNLGAWVKELERHALDARLTSFDLGFNFGSRDFAAHLTRGSDGRLSDLEVWKRPPDSSYGTPKISRLCETLDALPGDRLTAFRYVGKLSKGDKKSLETSLKRQKQLTTLDLV